MDEWPNIDKLLIAIIKLLLCNLVKITRRVLNRDKVINYIVFIELNEDSISTENAKNICVKQNVMGHIKVT